jgi:nucleoporin SEH1
MGQIFGSVGDDMELKIWQENPSQAKLSGRRFNCIYSQSSGNSVVYSCLDFLNIRYDTYLAVITRDGLLSLMEPVEHTAFDDWKELDQIIVCGDYIARGVETQFRVSFQKTPQPNYAAVKAGVDKKALSLAVTAMDKVYVYRIERTGDSRDGSYKFQAPVAALTGSDGLFRDVAWSNAFFLPIDRIVTAADDGYVRIYELKTQDETNVRSQDITKTGQGGESSAAASARPSSGIGAGLAGPSYSPGFAGVRHEWKVLSRLKHEGVWRVVWQPNCKYPSLSNISTLLNMLASKLCLFYRG